MVHKLGIVVQAANQGNQDIFQKNKEEGWAKSIDDLRIPMGGLAFSNDDTEPAIYIKFLGEKGYLLALVFTDRGGSRSGDNTTVWVHVPAACDISNTETVEVIEQIKEIAKTGNFVSSPIYDKIAGKTYPDKGVLLPAVSTICSDPKASKYGVRRLSDFTLQELLGNNIAQQVYAKYKGIFLLNKSVGFGNNFEELGAEEPKEVRTLQAPKSQEGFEPYIVVAREDVPFTKAVEFSDGADVCIKWKKEDYKAISKPAKVTAKEEDFQKIIKIDASKDIYKEVHRDNIKVSGSDGNSIANFEVWLNRLPEDRKIFYVPTRRECKITIKADEYEDKDVTLKELTSDKGIKLEKKQYTYRFALEGSKEEYILTTQRRLTKSPIKGYSADDDISEKGVNKLSYDGIWQKVMYFGIGFGACLLAIGLCVGWNVFVMDREFKFEDKQETGLTAPQDEGYTLTDMQKAFNYLESNDTWHKDSLDRFDATRGLFDELNEFEVNKIKDRNATLNNDKLGKIVEALEQIPADSRPGTHDGKYNTKDDKQININNYINSITNTATPQSQTTPSVPQQNDVPTQAPAPDPAPASPRSHSKGQTIRPASAQNKKPAKKNAKKATDKSGAGKNDGTGSERGGIK